MRWAIRQQILVPILLIQTVSVAVITLISVRLAERRAEREIVNRLEGVLSVLETSNFPLTGPILARMQGLSGARFIVYDPSGRTTAASDPGLLEAAPALASIPTASPQAVPSLGTSPTLRIDGHDHLAAGVFRPAAGPRPGESLLVLYPEASWREARRAAVQVPLLLGAGALVLMAASTSWIAHRISARVHRLEKQVARIAEGDFRELPRGSGAADEVQDLAASINRMCGQLREMSRTIRDSERAGLLAQLAAGLAHQLRNALTGARLSIQLHQKRCEPARSEPSMAVALRQLTLIEEQVRGLLTLGQVESRPPTAADLGTLVQDVALLLQPTSDHARVALRVESPLAAAPATVDEPGVRAAVLNLALNAIEAAGSGGSASLGLRRTADSCTIVVDDTGPGPPPSTRDSLFEPFVTGKPEGIGLGLALARQVAEAHHGSLSWSRDDGRTRFLFTIPLDVPASPPG
jgi:signal transduction histidine kinase